ncbi:glucose-1-phosphate thymidylyltransferase [Nonomuraea sp. NEAU-A123]|uniref:glucose-1-phosphate thymidylyltransferase n=1 Tax=Nonomuraea sp. NEAU-A123 TaxID=2839649 RepID=UPI001BE4732D|nr:glucose-1-phosphate thymidylyltransferase [Nonomuraea sp. NEAU-A123]MBT2226785.1 glucose-1-phosphate thymidylyltransferase [Nonomuraea sp. NEAU-A123]
MKGLVLAGGHGTRLRPLSHAIPKQLFPVANRPILWHGLEAMRDARITDVGIVVGDHEAQIRESVGDGSAFDLRITYIRQPAPLGLGHAVLISGDYLGADDFLMYLGDNIVRGGLDEVLRRFRESGADATVMLSKVADPREYGVAELGVEDRVTRLEEKSPAPRSDLAIVGVYAFSPAIHDAVRATKPSHRDEREITDAIQKLVTDGRDVRAHVHTGYWKDTGRPESLLDCNAALLEDIETRIDGQVDGETAITGPVIVERGAMVSRSRLVGPIIIGADATVSGSYVGPYTSIGPRCIVHKSEIGYSILLEDAEIHEVGDIDGSIVGRNAYVTSGRPSTHRMLLSDHSRVSIGS